MSKRTNLWTEILDEVTSSLRDHGIDLDEFGCTTDVGDGKVKVVFMAPGLSDSVKAMNKSVRDKVVMVRLDEESSRTLDDWVDAGAVKSRSEAAALFIREGLQVRAGDLARLQDALRDLEDARDRLRRQARDILGKDANDEESESDATDHAGDNGPGNEDAENSR